MQQHNMVANIFPRRPPPPPTTHHRPWCQKVKNQLYQKMIMFHIKLNGMANAATW